MFLNEGLVMFDNEIEFFFKKSNATKGKNIRAYITAGLE